MIRRILRGALIGAATVFASKLPHQHWSTQPTATVVVEDHADPSGDPPAPN
jgi:hypothetical protein